jgi:hypothetical protein
LTSATSPAPASPSSQPPLAVQGPTASPPTASEDTKTCHFIRYTVGELLKLRNSPVVFCFEELPDIIKWLK